MGIAINRITKQVQFSVSEHDSLSAQWLFVGGKTELAAQVNALISRGVPSKYWHIEDGVGIREMAGDEKTVADAAVLAEAKARRTRAFAAEVTQFITARYPEPTQRTILMYMATANLDNRVAYLSGMQLWVDSILAVYYAKAAEIAAAADEQAADAVTLDLTPFIETDPRVSVAVARTILD
jgi:hypothetical protein